MIVLLGRVAARVAGLLTRRKIKAQLKKGYWRGLTTLAIHVTLVLLALLLVVRHYVTSEIALFIICIIYTSLLLFTLYSLLETLCIIVKLVTDYRQKRGVLWWFFGKEMVTSGFEEIIDNAPRILIVAACFLVCSIVTPFVVEWTTDMNLIEAILYPILVFFRLLVRCRLIFL